MIWQDTTIPWAECTEERQDLLRKAWGAGELSYKLDSSQLEIYHHIKRMRAEVPEQVARRYVMDIGRRWGKDYVMGVLAAEVGMTTPKGRIPYGAGTKESVRSLLVPILRHILSDCPPELEPEFIESRKEYIFPNGCEMRLVGVNQDPDALRGNFASAVFLTEVAFYRRPTYVVGSCIVPMLMTSPDAYTVMGSTPPESPEHEWSREYVPAAKVSGWYSHRTIDDNPRITEATKESFIEEAGGRKTTRCRREYYAEHVVEETLAIVPEFSRERQHIVIEWERPEHFDPCVALDVGFSDFSVAGLGYFDFREDTLIIEDEVAMQRQTSDKLDEAIAGKEAEIYEGRPILHRWVDAQPMVVAELNRSVEDPRAWFNADDCDEAVRKRIESEGGRFWIKTRNDDLQAMVNATRVKVGQHKIRVHPRCKTIVAHMEHGVWKETISGTPRQFARSGKAGHFDGVAQMLYFDRNVPRSRNPYPPAIAGLDEENTHIPESLRVEHDRDYQTLQDLFGGRK